MLLITNPIIEYKNKYVVFTTCMHGDADFYTNHELPFDENEVDILEIVANTFHKYFNNKGYNKRVYAYSYLEDKYDELNLEDLFYELQSYDKTCDVYPSDVRSFNIYYYDSNGIKYDVEVVNDNK